MQLYALVKWPLPYAVVALQIGRMVMKRPFLIGAAESLSLGGIAGGLFCCAPHRVWHTGISQHAAIVKMSLDFPSIAAYATKHRYRAICYAESRYGCRGDYFIDIRSDPTNINPRRHILAVPGLLSPIVPPDVISAQPPRARPPDPSSSSPTYPSTPRSRRSVRHHSCYMKTLSVELLSSPLFFVLPFCCRMTSVRFIPGTL